MMPEIRAFLMTQHRTNSLGNVAKRDLRRVVSLSFGRVIVYVIQ